MVAISLLGWFALCCLLGVYYGEGILAPLLVPAARQHFLNGLPGAMLAGFLAGSMTLLGISIRVRRAADARTQQQLREGAPDAAVTHRRGE